MKPLVVGTAFSMFFPAIPNLRKRVFELEDRLQEVMTVPFHLLPFPDDIPDEIPRITALSKSGHSRLTVSKVSLGFETTYDSAYQVDDTKCEDYLNERVPKLSYLIHDFCGGHVFYQGVAAKLVFPWPDKEAALHLYRTFLPDKLSVNPCDISVKVTLVGNDQFYVNWQLSNARTVSGETSSLVSLSTVFLGEEAIELTLDINDRHAFNQRADYRSTPEVSARLVSEVFERVRKTASCALEGGGLR